MSLFLFFAGVDHQSLSECATSSSGLLWPHFLQKTASGMKTFPQFGHRCSSSKLLFAPVTVTTAVAGAARLCVGRAGAPAVDDDEFGEAPADAVSWTVPL